jgi:hypothetical protein
MLTILLSRRTKSAEGTEPQRAIFLITLVGYVVECPLLPRTDIEIDIFQELGMRTLLQRLLFINPQKQFYESDCQPKPGESSCPEGIFG